MRGVPRVDEPETAAYVDGGIVARGVQRVHLRWASPSGPRSHTVEQRTVVGSSPTVDCVVEDPTVSRLHCEIEPRPEGVWIRDLDSRNGVRVNGMQVAAACLPDGARVRLGAVELHAVYDQHRAAPPAASSEGRFQSLLGSSLVMRQLFASLARVAASDAPVLIRGETGTGKELVARSIHDASRRSGRPYVVVDCASLPESLLETELFGHARGAFTGAASPRAGAFESAVGGTIFLDEIGELPLGMQPKLLRALESKTIRRVGETEYRTIDVRFVAATHRDLLGMVSRGEFREDLYFRLSVLPVHVPPLRDRLGDVEVLARHFAQDATLDEAFLRSLRERPWRGNVRELRNVVERYRVFGEELGGTEPNAPPPPVVESGAHAAIPPLPDPSLPFRTFRDLWLDAGERFYTKVRLERAGGNVARAAQEAGIDRTYFYKVLKRTAKP